MSYTSGCITPPRTPASVLAELARVEARIVTLRGHFECLDDGSPIGRVYAWTLDKAASLRAELARLDRSTGVTGNAYAPARR